MEREVEVATDPVFSREALEKVGPDKVKPKPLLQFRARTTQKLTSHVITGVNRTSNEQNQRKDVCYLCGGTHDLDDCKDYMKKTLTERRKFLFEQRLCYACYKTGHRSRGCTKKRQCKVCLGCHPTGLHDYNFRQSKTSDGAEAMKTKDKDSKQSESQESSSKIVAIEVNKS